MENQSLELQALYHKAMECYRLPSSEKHEEGLIFLREAAEKGMSEACKLLGILCMTGQYDPFPRENLTEAVRWYKRAALAGDEEAMFWLSQCYEDGVGVQESPSEARYWRELAFENGFESEESASVLPPVKESPKLSARKASDKNLSFDQDAVFEGSSFNGVAGSFRNLRGREEDIGVDESLVRKVQLRFAVSGALFCGISLGILWLIVFLIFQKPLSRGGGGVFWLMGMVLFVGAALLGGYFGIQRSSRLIGEEVAYRHSPFYRGFGYSYQSMSREGSWYYKIYRAFERFYFPVDDKTRIEPELLREYRGALCPGWVFKDEGRETKVDFLVLTDRAGYVIRTVWGEGSLEGSLEDYEWILYQEKESFMDRLTEGRLFRKEEATRVIPNLIEENERSMAIIQKALEGFEDFSGREIPLYSVIFFGNGIHMEDLDLRGMDPEIILIQGTPDRLRGAIGVRDSRLPLHRQRMEKVLRDLVRLSRQEES